MVTRSSTRILTLCGIAIVAVAAVFAAQGTLQAQESEASGIVVGTYTPRDVAQQVGLEEKMRGEMEGLQQRMQAAQQQGNQQEMQSIQAEAQQVQQRIIGDFESNMDAAMAEVAEQTGVDVIAIEVSYTAPGIETKDVTSEIVAQLQGDDAPDVVLPQQ